MTSLSSEVANGNIVIGGKVMSVEKFEAWYLENFKSSIDLKKFESKDNGIGIELRLPGGEAGFQIFDGALIFTDNHYHDRVQDQRFSYCTSKRRIVKDLCDPETGLYVFSWEKRKNG
jgi:hypothetical protein